MQVKRTVADRIADLLALRGPLRRSEIAAGLHKTQSTIYSPLRKNPHRFRQVSREDKRWELVPRPELPPESISNRTTVVNLGAEYTEAESAFLREVAKWRAKHGVQFMGPIESLRLLVWLGWARVPVIQGGASDME
jgi:hypothetical protein